MEDLEKASEATNHENGRLRAQVEKMSIELKEYRKRMSLNSTGAGYSPPPSATPSRSYGNGNDFQFNFPKFGDLPSSFLNNNSITKTTSPPQMDQRSASASSISPTGLVRKSSSGLSSVKSPQSFNGMYTTPLGSSRPSQISNNGLSNNNYGDFDGLFDPSILENARTDFSPYTASQIASTPSTAKQGSVSSVNGHARIPNLRDSSSASIIGSPTSSMSHGALDSSCGTTPESSADSPDNRKASEGGYDTVNEEGKAQTKGTYFFGVFLSPTDSSTGSSDMAKSPSVDINGIDWMAQQNGGTFDPVLFGDYRDPQDNILNNNTLGDFFNDAFPTQDFGTPYYTGEAPPKRDLMQEVEVLKNANPGEVVSKEKQKHPMPCEKLWFVHCRLTMMVNSPLTLFRFRDRIQASEKVQSGEADMDDLCSQLKAKAKCSGKGAMIDQEDVDRILGPVNEEPPNFLKMFS